MPILLSLYGCLIWTLLKGEMNVLSRLTCPPWKVKADEINWSITLNATSAFLTQTIAQNKSICMSFYWNPCIILSTTFVGVQFTGEGHLHTSWVILSMPYTEKTKSKQAKELLHAMQSLVQRQSLSSGHQSLYLWLIESHSLYFASRGRRRVAIAWDQGNQSNAIYGNMEVKL